jgi:hypothetical protein
MTLKIGINGFGRIGRLVARITIKHPEVELVGVKVKAASNTRSIDCRCKHHWCLDRLESTGIPVHRRICRSQIPDSLSIGIVGTAAIYEGKCWNEVRAVVCPRLVCF